MQHRDEFSVSRMCRQLDVSHTVTNTSAEPVCTDQCDIERTGSGDSCPVQAQARLNIVDWIEGFYNRQRMHSAIDYQIPVNAESGLIAA